MKTYATFVLADSRGQVYEVRNRAHACRIEFSHDKVTRYWEGNPIPLAEAVEAVNDYRRAQYADYQAWAQKNGLDADQPIALVSA